MASIVKHTDKRSGITYAYESISYWDKETKMPRCKRKLIGRVDPETGEIRPTDGRCKKNSPYQKPEEESAQEKILARLKGVKVSELKKEIVRLELELDAAKKQIENLQNQQTNLSPGEIANERPL